VDLSRRFAVRAHATGVDVYDLVMPTAPKLVGSAPSSGGQISSVGVGVKFFAGGAFAVRSGPVGIDVFSIAPDGKPAFAGAFASGVPSTAINTAVAVDHVRQRAVRAHATGIEVYDLSNPASPQRIGQRSGTASTTGVGVVSSGLRAIRSTNVSVEVYDLTDLANIPAASSLPATPSSVGVGLAGGLASSIPEVSGRSLP
jgi:hypothetical protein